MVPRRTAHSTGLRMSDTGDGSADSVGHVLRCTPRHHQGCHERLKIAALLGHPLSGAEEFRLRIGQLLHSNVAESIILLVVSVELLTAITELGIEHGFVCLYHLRDHVELPHGIACEDATGEQTAVILEAFERMSGFTTALFAFEMMMKVLVAPVHVIKNPWHLLDLAVVGTNVALTLFSHQTAHMAFGLRWWRIIRFLHLIEEEAVLVEQHIRKRLEHEMRSTALQHGASEATETTMTANTAPPGQAWQLLPAGALERGALIGGGVGVVIGTTAGAAAGIIPALFTFGLSIPIFAAGGGGAGLFATSDVSGIMLGFHRFDTHNS